MPSTTPAASLRFPIRPSAFSLQPLAFSLALTYAYDKNGNKIGSTEKGTLNWPMPSLTDEKADYTAAGRLKTRSITPSGTNAFPSPGGEGQGEGGPNPQQITYHYDASGNMTNAAGIGQSWSLSYDEDNRTTSIHWDWGGASKLITNRFDALGRRIAKTADGTQTGYVLDLAGGMERILCDLNSSGAITAWYIHGLDLCFKVAPDATLTCYHADAMANIIATTGSSTHLLSQYAYTPYGRSLSSTNFQSQISNPYLFVGSQGVMEDLPGLYFMRARYYSAEAGVFLSTDPVKHIGPGWHPTAYAYVYGNPLTQIDPSGQIAPAIGAAIILGVIGVQPVLMWLHNKYVPEQPPWILKGHEGSASGYGIIMAEPVISDSDWRRMEEFRAKDYSTPPPEEDLSGISNPSEPDRPDWMKPGYEVRGTSTSFGQNQLSSKSRSLSFSGTSQFRAPSGSAFGQNSIASATPAAATYAMQNNTRQETPAEVASSYSGTSSSSGGGGGGTTQVSGGSVGAFSRTVQAVSAAVNNAVNSATQNVRNVANNVGQAISNAVSSVKRFFSGLFGRSKP